MQSNQVHNRIISSSNMFSLIKSSPLGVCITDEQGKFIFVNNAYCALYGYQADELIGQDFTTIVPQQARDELMALHHAFIHSSLEDSEQVLTELRSEWTVIDRQGNPLTIIANAVLLVGKDGARSKATFVTDITQQKNAEEKLLRANRQLAYHASRDELTGLLNRRAGMERVSREIALGRAQSKPLSVAFLDVDHFKKINDTHGHQVGDEVLREISGLIAREVRVGDCAIRYGGEEILVVLPATNATQAVAVIDRLRSALHVQRLSSKQIAVTFSAGIAEYSSGDRRKLLAVADKALYAAKNAGRDRSVVG